MKLVRMIWILSIPAWLSAQIITDGSLGPQQALSGPDMAIGQDLGQLRGSNLFHSFAQFDVAQSETATFSGDAGIQNIFSRVTGGGRSVIHGTIASTIDGANVYLMNPRGVLFGATSKINIPGAFVATSADQVSFDDDTVFEARAEDVSLTTAAPQAFGFLGENPGTLRIQGAEWTHDGALALVAPRVHVVDSALRVNSGEASSTLSIQASAAFLLEDSSLTLTSDSTTDAGSIDIQAGAVTIHSSSVQDHGIYTVNQGPSEGGDIQIVADSLSLDSARIRAAVAGPGGAGEQAPNNNTGGEGQNPLPTMGGDGGRPPPGGGAPGGQGGARELEAGSGNDQPIPNSGRTGSILIGLSGDFYGSGQAIVSTRGQGTGAAGDVSIRAANITLAGSRVLASNTDQGAAGDVTLSAPGGAVLLLDASEVRSDASGSSPAGTVSIVANSITVENSYVYAQSSGAGDAGDISLTGGDLIELRYDLDGGGNDSHLLVAAAESGTAGNISLSTWHADSLADSAASEIRINGAGIISRSRVNAANVTLDSGSIVLNRALIESEAGLTGRDEATDSIDVDTVLGGGIQLTAIKGVSLVDSSVTVEAKGAYINAEEGLALDRVRVGTVTGGTIAILAGDEVAMNSSAIEAGAWGAHVQHGGDLTVNRLEVASVEVGRAHDGRTPFDRTELAEQLAVEQLAAVAQEFEGDITVLLASGGDIVLAGSDVRAGSQGLHLTGGSGEKLHVEIKSAEVAPGATLEGGIVEMLAVGDVVLTELEDRPARSGPPGVNAEAYGLNVFGSYESVVLGGLDGSNRSAVWSTEDLTEGDASGPSFFQFGEVNGGKIRIFALGQDYPSNLFVSGEGGAGAGLSLNAQAFDLHVDAGGSRFLGGGGGGGMLLLQARNDVQLRGTTILAGAGESGANVLVEADSTLHATELQIRGGSGGSGAELQMDGGREIKLHDSSLEVEARQEGANVFLFAREQILLDNARIFASAGTDGGLIDIDPWLVLLSGGSLIEGRAGSGFEPVKAKVTADVFLQSADSMINTDTLDSPVETNVNEGVPQIRAHPVQEPKLVRSRCAAPQAKGVSRLVVSGRSEITEFGDYFAPESEDHDEE